MKTFLMTAMVDAETSREALEKFKAGFDADTGVLWNFSMYPNKEQETIDKAMKMTAAVINRYIREAA